MIPYAVEQTGPSGSNYHARYCDKNFVWQYVTEPCGRNRSYGSHGSALLGAQVARAEHFS